MKKNSKLLATLICSTVLAGPLSGCASDQVLYERPANPPQVQGYNSEDWEWDEEDGEWEYPISGGHHYFYNGALYAGSIRSSGIKSNATVKSSTKSGGFGSGSKGSSSGG